MCIFFLLNCPFLAHIGNGIMCFIQVRLCGLKHTCENHHFRRIASNANGYPFTPYLKISVPELFKYSACWGTSPNPLYVPETALCVLTKSAYADLNTKKETAITLQYGK